MRVTDTGAHRGFLLAIRQQREALDRANSEIMTGRRLQRPSDDPVGADQVLRLQASRSQNEQYLENAQYALSKLEHTDTIIDHVQLALNKAVTLTLQGLSGVTTAQQREILATQIGTIRDQLVGLANTSFQGEHIFAGTANQTAPYTNTAGTVTFGGNSDPIYSRIDNSTLVQTNVTGDELLAGVTDVFAVLNTLQTALTANDEATLRQGLDDLRSAIDNTDVVRGQVGATINHLQTREQEILEENARLVAGQSRLEDANIVEAAVRLNESETALQAAFNANARLLKLSLLDYLR